MTKVDLMLMRDRTCELAARDYPCAVKVLEFCKFAESTSFWQRTMACGDASLFRLDRDENQAPELSCNLGNTSTLRKVKTRATRGYALLRAGQPDSSDRGVGTPSVDVAAEHPCNRNTGQ
jgi:hypothetical protein